MFDRVSQLRGTSPHGGQVVAPAGIEVRTSGPRVHAQLQQTVVSLHGSAIAVEKVAVGTGEAFKGAVGLGGEGQEQRDARLLIQGGQPSKNSIVSAAEEAERREHHVTQTAYTTPPLQGPKRPILASDLDLLVLRDGSEALVLHAVQVSGHRLQHHMAVGPAKPERRHARQNRPLILSCRDIDTKVWCQSRI